MRNQSKATLKLAKALFLTISFLTTTGHANEKSAAQIRIDGSSTVYPLTEAVAEDFQAANKTVRISIGVSGTGGGFKKFLNNEIDIAEASRKISESEAKAAAEKKLEYLELPVAFDGLTVVVHPKNTFAEKLSFAELKKIWEPGSKVKLWSDVNPSWPKRAIKLFGAGADSGTFDYFTEAVNGKSKASRADYMASEDDNALVRGVSGDVDALGYFGYAYFEGSKNRVKAVALSKDDNANYIKPSQETIANLSYPLSREVYLYASKAALERKEIRTFLKFYLESSASVAKEVGFVPLSATRYKDIALTLK